MEKNLILTGWGRSDYVAAAAAALKALGDKADVMGISRRRLPEFMEECGARRQRIIILGVSLSGDPVRLAKALAALRSKGVKVTWISAIPKPDSLCEDLDGLMEELVYAGSLVEAVGEAFNVDVEEFLPFASDSAKPTGEPGKFRELTDAAQFHYRNYQDESIYATAVRYLSKGVKSSAWSPEIRAAIEHYGRYGDRELNGKSQAVTALHERIARVARHGNARVLILGESGTGKETVAQQIHTKSPRVNEPFIAFNCATVSKELLESRFFGHEKGAFTGADKQFKGLFEQADGGTLFLDEIGEMSLEVQALLLRVLEGGRFQRVGGSDEVKVDVRLITATNRNLPAMVRDGKFREDLFMRLNVVQLRVPSLRERKEDIPEIANMWWRRHHEGKVLNAKQLAALQSYDYPGNVRELINILDRATALEECDFELLLREHREMNADLVDSAGTASDIVTDELDAAIRLHIRKVYEKYGRNLTKAAEALKVSRNTVRKYL